MRFVTLAVLLYVAFASAFTNPYLKAHKAAQEARNVDSTCTTFTCATTGQACSLTAVCVSSDTYCDAASATCLAQKANGAACTSGAQCTSSYCLNQVCTAEPANAGANGQACTFDSQCDSDNCVSSVCTGAQIGGSCSSTENCNIDFSSCDETTDKCVQPLGLGAACSTDNDLCASGLFCQTTTCVPFFSGAAGSACSSDDHCGDNLGCSLAGTCAAPAASSNTACTSDSGCTAATEACLCNYGTGQGKCTNIFSANPKGASDLASKISSCYKGACATNPNNNCAESKCNSAYCAVNSYFYNQLKTAYNAGYPSCLAGPLLSEITKALKESTGCSVSVAAFPMAASVAVVAFAATVTIALGL